MNGHLEGEQPYLGDLLTMVINHLLNGMTLQVTGFWAHFVNLDGFFWRFFVEDSAECMEYVP